MLQALVWFFIVLFKNWNIDNQFRKDDIYVFVYFSPEPQSALNIHSWTFIELIKDDIAYF